MRTVLEASDERGKWAELAAKLDLLHLLDRQCEALSGGELQRLAICRTACVQADVYMFDEPSSFLDIKQRTAAVDVIRALVSDEDGGDVPERYVIVVEHDLAVLDFISDYICCLYGEPGAYGVVTKIASVGNGINQYLAGYFPAENLRFRSEPISFENQSAEASSRDVPLGALAYPEVHRTHVSQDRGSSFTLHVEAGAFRPGEVVGMLGENGCGKTTFMELLARTLAGQPDGDCGAPKAPNGDDAPKAPNRDDAPKAPNGDFLKAPSGTGSNNSLVGVGVSYKRQHYAQRLRRFDGTVQALLERCIQPALADRLFRLLVLQPLDIEPLEHANVRDLSGGQLQRVAIALCLGQPATVGEKN